MKLIKAILLSLLTLVIAFTVIFTAGTFPFLAPIFLLVIFIVGLTILWYNILDKGFEEEED